jgi:hypothetical protein
LRLSWFGPLRLSWFGPCVEECGIPSQTGRPPSTARGVARLARNPYIYGREMAELIVVTSLQSAVAQLLQGGLEPLLYTFVRGE